MKGFIAAVEAVVLWHWRKLVSFFEAHADPELQALRIRNLILTLLLFLVTSRKVLYLRMVGSEGNCREIIAGEAKLAASGRRGASFKLWLFLLKLPLRESRFLETRFFAAFASSCWLSAAYYEFSMGHTEWVPACLWAGIVVADFLRQITRKKEDLLPP